MTRLQPGLSPCRRHPCSVEHAGRVTGFRELARLWEDTAEAVTGGYATELLAYAQDVPRPLFRDWLIHTRNP